MGPDSLMRIILLLAGVLVSGCAFRSSDARSHGRAGSLEIASSNAGAPATASRQVDRSTVTIPAGSVLELGMSNNPAYKPLRATLAAPAELVKESTRDELATATAPASPAPADVAKADGVRAYWRASLVLFALGALFAWRAHWLAAGCAALAGVALPALASFLSGQWAVLMAVLLIGAAVAFVAGWHVLRMRGHLTAPA